MRVTRSDCGTSPAAAVSVGVLPTGRSTTAEHPTVHRDGSGLPGTRRATVPFIDTINTARDMDRIRQALGLSKISYYGLSYGTVSGAVYATCFPTGSRRWSSTARSTSTPP